MQMIHNCIGISAVTVQLAFFLSGVSTGILRVLCTNSTVDPFGKALLVCTARGIPGDASITMDWNYAGMNSSERRYDGILGNDTNHVVTKVGHRTTLVIKEIGKNDVGPYHCVMAALGETVWKIAYVFARPYMTFSTRSTTVDVGDTARIECISWGWEVPTIAWYRDGRRLGLQPRPTRSTRRSRFADAARRRRRRRRESPPSSDDGARLTLLPNSDGQKDGLLRLTDVQLGDRATYNCTSSNSHGSNYRTKILRVRGEWQWVWPLVTVALESLVVAVVLLVTEAYRKRKRFRVNDVRPPRVVAVDASPINRTNQYDNNSKNLHRMPTSTWNGPLTTQPPSSAVDLFEEVGSMNSSEHNRLPSHT